MTGIEPGPEGFRRTRRMILGRVLLVPFVVVLLVFGTLSWYFLNTLRGQVGSHMVRIADDHRRLIEQFLSERFTDLEITADLVGREDLARESRLAEALASLQARSHAFFDLGVIDEEGKHLAYVGPFDLKGKNYSSAEWFRSVKEKKFYCSDVFLGYRRVPHFVIAIEHVDKGRPWYLRATIDTQFFNELVENVQIGRTGEAFLVNEQGLYQTRRRSGGSLMEEDPDFALYLSDARDISSFAAVDHEGVKYLYVTGKLREPGWLLVVRQAANDAYGPLARAALVGVALIVGGGAVVVVMGFMLATSVANQLTVAYLEKRRMTGQLIMAGKLAEVGEMSAGLAHEINNPLQIIVAEQTLIKELLGDVEADPGPGSAESLRLIRDSLEQIGVQVERCSRITQGLLKFARKTETTRQRVTMSTFLPETARHVEKRAGLENIRIRTDVAPGLRPVETDPAMLQQVLMNLFNNAIHALEGRDAPEIRVSASMDGGDLVVTVADNGCGIPEENLGKIFMPFFTTKRVGQGTGLGLSTCYGIMEQLDGTITVASEINVGTVFTLHLPAGRRPAGEAGASSRPREPAGQP